MLDDKDINLEQIKAGMAWHYKQYQRDQTPDDRKLYAEAEAAAKKRKVGLWAERDPVPPWEYRTEKKVSERQR